MSEWKIIIADRGWIYIGRPTREGDQIVIRDCYNVRRWGTTSGLGQLALDGPTDDTILDPCPTVSLHVLSVPGGSWDADDNIWFQYHKRQAEKARRK